MSDQNDEDMARRIQEQMWMAEEEDMAGIDIGGRDRGGGGGGRSGSGRQLYNLYLKHDK